MNRGMGPAKAKLLVILLISAILVLSSAVQVPVLVQCKHHCKHDLQNKKECEDSCNEKMTMMMKEEDQDNFCEVFCKTYGEGIYQRCMTVCPRTIQDMMVIEQEEVEGGFDDVAKEDLQTKCNRKCTSYTANESCMSQCFRSMIGKSMDNKAICESSCSVIQERPLIIRCIRVCHEIIPGADLLLLKQ